MFDVRQSLLIGLDFAEYALGRQNVAQNFVNADDFKALGFDILDDRSQQMIVAERFESDFGKEFRRPPIGAQLKQRRTADGTDHHDFLDALFMKELDRLARFAQANPQPDVGAD